MVSPRDRRGALPDRRHLVADRDGVDPDLTAPRGDHDQARLVHAAAAGDRGGHRRRSRHAGEAARRRRLSRDPQALAGHAAHHLAQQRPLHRRLLGEIQQPLLRGGRQRAPRQGRLFLDHGTHRRRAERRRTPPRHHGDRVGAGGTSARGGSRRRRQASRDQRRVGVRLCRDARRAADGRHQRSGEGAARLGGAAARADRQAR